jgi:predicted SnoaL-like aldol condensation-catalyzing enzyme
VFVLVTEERKKEFTQLFDKYVELEKKKKTLASDTSIVIGDFKNRMTEGMEKWEKKSKKAEIDKYIRSKIEVTEGKDPVEDIPDVRVRHLDFASENIDLLDNLIEDKRSSTFQAKRLGEEQKDLVDEMLKFMVTTEDTGKAVIKELVAMSLGKIHIMDRIVEGVAEGKEILFGKES